MPKYSAFPRIDQEADKQFQNQFLHSDGFFAFCLFFSLLCKNLSAYSDYPFFCLSLLSLYLSLSLFCHYTCYNLVIIFTTLHISSQTRDQQMYLLQSDALTYLAPLLSSDCYRVQMPTLHCLANMCYKNPAVCSTVADGDCLNMFIYRCFYCFVGRDIFFFSSVCFIFSGSDSSSTVVDKSLKFKFIFPKIIFNRILIQ